MATKKRKPKPAEPKPDPARDLVHELREYVFDDDDFTVPVQLALIEGAVRESHSRGFTLERDAVSSCACAGARRGRTRPRCSSASARGAVSLAAGSGCSLISMSSSGYPRPPR